LRVFPSHFCVALSKKKQEIEIRIENTVGDAYLNNSWQQCRPKIILMNYFCRIRKYLPNGSSQKLRNSIFLIKWITKVHFYDRYILNYTFHFLNSISFNRCCLSGFLKYRQRCLILGALNLIGDESLKQLLRIHSCHSNSRYI
jgi:hypothetical protein